MQLLNTLHLKQISSVLLMLVLSSALAALELKPSITQYKASFENGLPISGTATHTLVQLSNKIWRYQFNVDSFFAEINESVYFQWTGEKVVPITYHFKRSGWAVTNRRATLEFNWKEHKLVMVKRGAFQYSQPGVHKGRCPRSRAGKISCHSGKIKKSSRHHLKRQKIKSHLFFMMVLHLQLDCLITVIY